MRRRLVLFSLALTVCVAAAGFASGHSEKPAGTTGSAAQPIHLTVWYLSQSPQEIALIQGLNKKYEVSTPGVTVDFSPYSFDAMNKGLKLALSSGTGPDIAYASGGDVGVMGYAHAGDVVDLTSIAKERGWTKQISPGLIALANLSTWNHTGSVIWGMPFDSATVGVFYNQNIFDQLGLKVPKTFGEFEAILAKLKQAGITPILEGGLDKWPIANVFENIVHVTTPIGEIRKLQFFNDGGTWNQPGIVQAAGILKDWVNKDYFNNNLLATSYNSSNSLFINGKGAMRLGGTWNNQTYIQEAKFPVRFFPLPRVDTNIPWHMGGYQMNNDWMVSKFTKHESATLDYLSYMLGEKVATALWESGDIPAYEFSTLPKATSQLQTDVYKAMQETGIGYFMGGPTPDIQNAEWNSLQDLVAGRLTPTATIEQIQKAYLNAEKTHS